MADIYRKLIFAMGDPSLSVIRHYEAATMIAASTENEALPYLIQALDDQRVFDPEYSRPSGAPDDPPVILTVGKRCESMLLYTFLQVTPKSAHSYRVKDWNAWWHQHRGMTLYEIQQSVRDWEKKDEALHPK